MLNFIFKQPLFMKQASNLLAYCLVKRLIHFISYLFNLMILFFLN
ncbi:unnamed protein product [Onchocerca flexuosa]|uniref:Uncharacterized protein n=1 Tax=Onchocerca flexuosa TaxID=387005 RepID=A0A183I886_9BILA|nr:unnamed protein product [Onchocerca flexuosa]